MPDRSSGRSQPVVRVAIHVQPGATHPSVGGSHGGALIVRVRERAVDGRATAAALAALATVLGLGKHDVQLVSGATHRSKIVEIPDVAEPAYTRLLGPYPL